MEDRHAIAAHCSGLVRGLVDGRKVILAGTLLAPGAIYVRHLRDLGAGPFLIVATGDGTGDLPTPHEADWVVHPVTAADTIDEFRQVERLMADPPPAIVEAVERFDPDHDALVFYPPFATSRELCGRAAYGARRPEWVALEDKTTCEIVEVDRNALLAAAARLDQGAGTVWSGDARDGFNGGGIFVRWIRSDPDPAAVDDAVARFAPACDHVRVAPFVEGIPCSVHGVVCPDGIAALRPVEMVNLRPPGASRLQYAGAGTWFDPPAADREQMRAAVRRLGALLQTDHGFAGTFTVDGIVGADGWVPTELNPRYGAGMGYASALYPDLAFGLLHQMVVEGDAPDVRATDIEALLLPAADDTRWGGGWSMIPTTFTETESVPVCFEGDRLRVTQPGEVSDGELMRGPNAVGGFVRLSLDPDRTPKGPSVAPRVVAALALADELWGAGIGPLEPARNVREAAQSARRSSASGEPDRRSRSE
jgi:hypothetical protein